MTPSGMTFTGHLTDDGTRTYAWDAEQRLRRIGDTTQPTAERLGQTDLTTWSYQNNAHDRRLSAIGHPAGLRSHTYTSDAYRISGVTETGSGTPLPPRTWTYQYDPADRLTLAAGPLAYQYQYDPADNLTNQASAQGTVNALNQLTSWNNQTLTHDAAGNLTQDASWQYRYDAEQRLVTVAARPPNTVTYRFRYDAWGRRVIETAIGTDTRTLWCGEAICQTRNASDTPTRYHYPQGELSGTQRLYYARDHLGSVREVRDLATDQTVAALDYTPYGAIRAHSGSLTPDRGFAGLWRHAPTGLYLTHYRAYSPAYGRWLSRDPIGEAGGVNLYGYVEGNPVNWVDPLGLEPKAFCEHRCESFFCKEICRACVTSFCDMFPVSPACRAISKDECIGDSGGAPEEMLGCTIEFEKCILRKRGGKKPPAPKGFLEKMEYRHGEEICIFLRIDRDSNRLYLWGNWSCLRAVTIHG